MLTFAVFGLKYAAGTLRPEYGGEANWMAGSLKFKTGTQQRGETLIQLVVPCIALTPLFGPADAAVYGARGPAKSWASWIWVATGGRAFGVGGRAA